MSVQIVPGDCLHTLQAMPDRSVNCCITSPPYYGLRDYGLLPTRWPAVECTPLSGMAPMTVAAEECCLGRESDPAAFVAHLVAVFREVRRVLRDDGVLWLNLGDSYVSSGTTRWPNSTEGFGNGYGRDGAWIGGEKLRPGSGGLSPKQQIGIPWRVAFALQADGWYLRQDIIWQKTNAKPESVTDRCTNSHEYIFLLSKSSRYYFNAEAIRERASSTRYSEMRNRRSVWTVPTRQFHGAHYATFPPELIEPCILSSCPVDGRVLDCFGGTGTTGLMAQRLGRNATLCELSSDSVTLARNRIQEDLVQSDMFGRDPSRVSA